MNDLRARAEKLNKVRDVITESLVYNNAMLRNPNIARIEEEKLENERILLSGRHDKTLRDIAKLQIEIGETDR